MGNTANLGAMLTTFIVEPEGGVSHCDVMTEQCTLGCSRPPDSKVETDC